MTRSPFTLLATAFFLTCFLCACTTEKEESDRRSALEEFAAAIERRNSPDRLALLEQRVAALEQILRDGNIAGALLPSKVDEIPPSMRASARESNAGREVKPAGQAHIEIQAQAPPKKDQPFSLTIAPPPTPETVVLWHSYRGKEKDAFERCLRDFTAKYPNIVTDPQEVPFSALRDKIVVTVPRGTGPDLVIYAHNNIGDWLLKGNILVPLSSYIEKYDSFDSLARFLPDTVKALAYEGTLYGLPLAFKSHALFYNRKLVTHVPTSFQELVTESKRVAALGGEGEDRVYGLVYDAGLLYNHALWAQGLGATILDENGAAHLDSPEMVRSVGMVRSLFSEHKVLPDLNDTMATFLFNSNKAGFVIKGPWFLGELDPDVEYGVALLPEIEPGKPARPFLGSEGVFLTKCARNKELAFQVMRYLVSLECAKVRLVDGAQLVANLAVYEDHELMSRANPALEVFRKQAENSVIMSSKPEMQAVWSTADNALRKAIFSDADITETLKNAQAKVSHDLASMRK